MKKVVSIDRPFPSFERLENELKALDAELVFAVEKDEAALCALCRDADAVIVTFTQITPAVIAAMERCRLIIRTGIGVDNIAVPEATAKNIKVSFVPDYCREEVADHTIALLLAAIRKLAFCQREARRNWDLKKTIGYVPRMSECTAGILGLGGIGKLIAARLQPFGVKVIAFDPFLPPEDFKAANVVQCLSADSVYEAADFIILSGPLTPDRYHMINEAAIKKMKPNAILINTARGPLVDETALVQALQEGRLAGAGLDVFEHEPIVNQSLYEVENLIITPHVAFYSEASLPDLQNKVFDEVLRSVKGEKLRNCVNIAQ